MRQSTCAWSQALDAPGSWHAASWWIVEALVPGRLLDEAIVQAHVHGAVVAIEGAGVMGGSGKVEVQHVAHRDSFCIERSCGILPERKH